MNFLERFKTYKSPPQRFSRFPSYLRTYRLTSGLRQNELAFLIGVDPSAIHNTEERTREPSLRHALAFELLFGAAAPDLIPKITQEVERAVLVRAGTLIEKLRGDTSPRAQAVCRTLEGTMQRIEQQNRQSHHRIH